jgi:outer membrane protein assembly factor BamB
VYSLAALRAQRLRKTAAVLCVAAASACAGRARAPRPPLFPLAVSWATPPLEAAVLGVASDGARVFVATEDGALRALDIETGATAWRVERRAGALAAAPGLLVVREPGGTVWSVDPRTGSARWKVDSAVPGELAPVIDGDRILVAGAGVAVLEAAGGRALWSLPGEPRIAAPPLPHGPLLVVAEADGTLRARDAGTGQARWWQSTGGPLWAAPAADDEDRLFVGTSARRFRAYRASDGRPGWQWKVGADVRFAPAVAGGAVIFASHEAVVYALKRGSGSLIWRGALASRPLSGPLVLPGGVLVASHGSRPRENFLVGFDLETGQRLGDLLTPSELQLPPIAAGNRVVLAMRDRTVAALSVGIAP